MKALAIDIWRFVKSLIWQWVTLMSGVFGVAAWCFTVWKPNEPVARVFEIFAGLSVLGAVFVSWRRAAAWTKIALPSVGEYDPNSDYIRIRASSLVVSPVTLRASLIRAEPAIQALVLPLPLQFTHHAGTQTVVVSGKGEQLIDLLAIEQHGAAVRVMGATHRPLIPVQPTRFTVVVHAEPDGASMERTYAFDPAGPSLVAV